MLSMHWKPLLLLRPRLLRRSLRRYQLMAMQLATMLVQLAAEGDVAAVAVVVPAVLADGAKAVVLLAAV
jgi:hypothetical protein